MQQRVFDERLPTCETSHDAGWQAMPTHGRAPCPQVGARPAHRLGAGSVELWRIDLGGCDARTSRTAGSEDLTDEDRRAADLIRDPVSRALFLAGRWAQRHILSAYVAQPPRMLRIARPAHGKPVLQTDPTLHFSFARRGTRALLAVAPVPVGIDLEVHRNGWRPQELMAVIGCAAERRRVSALAPATQADAVMRCWTAKEACLKASGWGLALPPHRFDVGPLVADATAPAWPLDLPSLRNGGGQSWTVQSLASPAGWSAALAVSALSGTPLRQVWRAWEA